jgi:UDP-4-amino-4,6-dideoxy-N-acetyl-beta-L-altrosamine transaminase
MIPYGKQNISEEDIAAVVEVLRSDFITQGPRVPAFETALATYCGTKHCVAANSATSALHIALLSLGVGPKDQVWTSPISFVASANCALYCGADVGFVDIDPITMNMDVDALASKLAAAKVSGSLPKVVIPVHLSGRSCDMKAIGALKEKYGFAVIEDASHAVGGSYENQKVGSCQYSDMTVFSFHPVKIITTAEGGAVLTNNSDLAPLLASYRSHGITRDPAVMTAADGPWYYEQHHLGYNYRMTEMQAALGLSQLKRLDAFIDARRAIVARYFDLLETSGLTLPCRDDATYQSAWHLYIIRVPETQTYVERRALYDKLVTEGVGVNVHYIPITRQPYYKALGFDSADYPFSERYYERAISIPVFYDLSQEQQDQIVDCILKPRGYQTLF